MGWAWSHTLLVSSVIWGCGTPINGVVNSHQGNHGGVPMGVPNNHCDDGKWNIQMDWDDSTDYQFRCQPWETHNIGTKTFHNKHYGQGNWKRQCLKKIPEPIHVCMTEAITYDDRPPVAGRHRPLWPVYGEYVYVPPQRWIHSLEHGAAVFLYHPCADIAQVASMRTVAENCLRKHILTPSRDLDPDMPFAVITYGCRLQMKSFDMKSAIKFVKDYAMKSPEKDVQTDGDYKYGLISEAKTVSENDQNLCPDYPLFMIDKMIAENMYNS